MLMAQGSCEKEKGMEVKQKQNSPKNKNKHPESYNNHCDSSALKEDKLSWVPQGHSRKIMTTGAGPFTGAGIPHCLAHSGASAQPYSQAPVRRGPTSQEASSTKGSFSWRLGGKPALWGLSQRDWT